MRSCARLLRKIPALTRHNLPCLLLGLSSMSSSLSVKFTRLVGPGLCVFVNHDGRLSTGRGGVWGWVGVCGGCDDVFKLFWGAYHPCCC